MMIKNDPLYILIEEDVGILQMIDQYTFPEWDTTSRPPHPKRGSFGMNTDTKKLEWYDGQAWHNADGTAV